MHKIVTQTNAPDCLRNTICNTKCLDFILFKLYKFVAYQQYITFGTKLNFRHYSKSKIPKLIKQYSNIRYCCGISYQLVLPLM